MEQELNFRRATEEEAEDMIIISSSISTTRNDQSQRGRRCDDDDQQQQITYHCRKALPPKSRANNLSRPLSVFQLCINNRSFIPHLLFHSLPHILGSQ
ncbi:hypothetical protein TYRP_013774 [Tyrophagus putrescentiae]|nr:hypothetical protein TYRP_013774 [Tyrophagus putrescentiae]